MDPLVYDIDLNFFHLITFAKIQTARFNRVFLENLNCPNKNYEFQTKNN